MRTIYKFDLPLKIVPTANLREHWGARARRAKMQRWAVKTKAREAGIGVLLSADPVGLAVEMVRIIGPRGRVLDDDNLSGGFKAVRDGVADALGMADNSRLLTWQCRQRRGDDWGVEVSVTVDCGGLTE